MYLYDLILFLITFVGGSIPLWNKSWTEQQMKYLLAFSGAYLLGITLLHLVPEVILENGSMAGAFILVGFFFQQIIQPFTHGVEHGHAHLDHGHEINIWPLFIGLGFHAFMEGMPLGVQYHDNATVPSLYIAIAFHKIPEAMLIASLVLFATKDRKKAWLSLAGFSLLTPIATILTVVAKENILMLNSFINYAIPFVAGAFIHISTTIFFESGTKKHEMDWKKWLTIMIAIAISMLTLLGGAPHEHVH